MPTKEELIAMIQKRNIEVRKDHERRYGKVLPEEAELAREKRIMETPEAWDKI